MAKYKGVVRLEADGKRLQFDSTKTKRVESSVLAEEATKLMQDLGYKSIRVYYINQRRLFLGVF